mmetsp:Transcript_21855/g.31724  ORF Transcript_21855/g.31724 Transcript_21855/m.31724 type:complete len:321 (-) Transcript_21855:257-1219(-)
MLKFTHQRELIHRLLPDQLSSIIFRRYDTSTALSISQKQAVVTGGSSGMGHAIAEILARAGAFTTVIDRDHTAFKEHCDTGGAFQYTKDKMHFVHADLSDASSTKQAAAEALSIAGGTVDILVNCAGVALMDPVETMSLEKFDATYAINVRAPFILAQALGPAMVEQRSGKIINISSQASKNGSPNHTAYCASKGALDGLTRALVSEWGCYNIQINSVNPTVVMTAMGRKLWGDPVHAAPTLEKIPAGRFGEPHEIADLVLFLASNKSNFINGQAISIDGGITAVSQTTHAEPVRQRNGHPDIRNSLPVHLPEALTYCAS